MGNLYQQEINDFRNDLAVMYANHDMQSRTPNEIRQLIDIAAERLRSDPSLSHSERRFELGETIEQLKHDEIRLNAMDELNNNIKNIKLHILDAWMNSSASEFRQRLGDGRHAVAQTIRNLREYIDPSVGPPLDPTTANYMMTVHRSIPTPEMYIRSGIIPNDLTSAQQYRESA